MEWIAYELASGRPLLFALGAIVVAMAVVHPWPGRAARVIGVGILVPALLVVAVGGVPLPLPWVVALFGASVAWLVVGQRVWRLRVSRSLPLVLLFLAPVLFVWGQETAWTYRAPLPLGSHSAVVVLGDSVSAGIGGIHERTWPELLAEGERLNVVNAAMAGARIRDALTRQWPAVRGRRGLVLLQIGGNDMLYGTPLTTFQSDLDELLREVRATHEAVVMFELPPPPLYAPYTRIQRSLALRHGVALIPRRHFTDVIRQADATVDGVHLSQQGHVLMAECVGEVLHGVLETGTSRYEVAQPVIPGTTADGAAEY